MTETSTADTAANGEIIRRAFDAWCQGTGGRGIATDGLPYENGYV
jgi:hypothetical protein